MAAGYRIFDVQLRRRIAVSPSLLRCVFYGEDVDQMKLEAPDQRIKLLFAPEGVNPDEWPRGDGWYQAYLALPVARRPILRTYTLRALRREQKEIDVEFVLHGDTGPASRWASQANPGARLLIVAPNGASQEDSGGYEWAPHPDVRQVLLIADETALPAAMGILEDLAKKEEPPQVQAFLEVPKRGDCRPETVFPFAEVFWLARDDMPGSAHGDLLLKSVRQHARIPASVLVTEQSLDNRSQVVDDIWECNTGFQPFYGWVAAESGTVKQLRHYLLGECGLDRNTINLMAYWSRRR